MARTRNWALVGSQSLLGREVRDVMADRKLPVDLKLIAAGGENEGALTEQSGEVTLLWKLEENSLRDARLVFLAGSADASAEALRLPNPPVLIDLTHAAEDDPRSFIRAPYSESDGFRAPEDSVHSIAHPAAIAISLVLPHLHSQYPIKRSVILIFEPASERGALGLNELQQQTVSLLSFKSMPKKVFDEQLSFNMLASYGESAPVSLESAELRIERHLVTLLSRAIDGSQPPMPSLRLIQAPVFHGYSLSLWVEFVKNPGVEVIEAALTGSHIDVRRSDVEPPTSAGMAGQSGIAVGAVTLDRNQPEACWVWLAADNLRLVAENAVAVAEQFL